MKDNARACKNHWDFNRCRLNRYNSGVHYARHGVHGTYWLRVRCFANAARAGLDVGEACRDPDGRRQVARILRTNAKPRLSQIAARRDIGNAKWTVAGL
jgi:hypothetical protein